MKLRNGAIINDRYIIDEKIGSGGMAIVYRATDTKLDRTVTLKVMREDYIQDDEFIERFYTEAQAAARLNHPNIVKVYDVDRIGDILFIVMEYINGITLKEAIRARKMFTNEEVLGVSIQIASAIDCAHKNHIIHRDIKPQNILLTPMGEVKVTDFGIARAANAKTTTATSTTLGSVHYFSPEQARGGYVDHKSDIYALGITMFEMASGRLPFDDETVVTIALKHINDELPDLKEINPRISDAVCHIIAKATEKSQMKRYSDAEVMGNDLKKALTTESFGGGPKDYEDLSLTQTLKISEADMNKIRSNNHKNVEIENVSDEYRDDVKVVPDDRKRKEYERRQRERLHEGRVVNQGQRRVVDNVQEQKSNNKKLYLYAILIGLLLSFVVIGFAMWGYSRTLKDPMEVPNLLNMTVEQAEELGKEEGFEVLVAEYQESEEFAEGLIIDQDYKEGDKFYQGGKIKVIVSSGYTAIATQSLPDVTGMDEDEAKSRLEELGFSVKVNEVDSAEFAKGTVVEQIPLGDQEVEEGSFVSIYVSTGEAGEESAKTIVPPLLGLTEEEAKADIESAKLLYDTNYKFSSTVEEGLVISQSMSDGQEVAEGTKITIVVSKGEEVIEPETPVEESETTGETEVVPVTKTVVVDQTMIPSGYETVFVKVTVDSTGKVLYEKEVGVNDFPINISVTGTGTETFKVYSKIPGGEYKESASNEVNFEN